jgi:hypothetical protein
MPFAPLACESSARKWITNEMRDAVSSRSFGWN